MKQIQLEGGKIDDLLEFFSGGEECVAQVQRGDADPKVGFFVYEHFYMRVSRRVSCSVLLYQSSSENCEITIVGSGGESLIGIDYGAKESYEDSLTQNLLAYAGQIGLTQR